jgi:hypothetical protein
VAVSQKIGLKDKNIIPFKKIKNQDRITGSTGLINKGYV